MVPVNLNFESSKTENQILGFSGFGSQSLNLRVWIPKFENARGDEVSSVAAIWANMHNCVNHNL